MDNTAFELLDNLHNSFMSLHEERMKEINKALENLQKTTDPSDNAEKLDEISKALEDLLKE